MRGRTGDSVSRGRGERTESVMRILGIDPGLRICGYGCIDVGGGGGAVLVEAGVLRFEAKGSMEERLGRIHGSLVELIGELRPTHVAVEKLYAHYKHPRTAILMAHARGVILLAAGQAGLGVRHLPATEVKKSLTGNGHATKRQMQGAIAGVFRLKEPPSPPDVADALAIALCAARRIARPVRL